MSREQEISCDTEKNVNAEPECKLAKKVNSEMQDKGEHVIEKMDGQNYLDLIPQRSSALNWYVDIRERIVLEIENTGFFDRIAQKYFGKPKTTKVHLDPQGSYLWPLIDGKRSVYELAALQKERFGEKAEPLYPRIIKYMQILESYHFIYYLNKVEEKSKKGRKK